MDLKMYAFGEEDGVVYWICAHTKEEAINLYKSNFGEEVWEEAVESYDDEKDFVREMDSEEDFIYYHDGMNGVSDTIKNHIAKYCNKPGIFACSEF